MAEPLDPLATAYLDSLVGKASATVEAYRRSLRHFLAWLQAKLGCESAFDPTTFTRTAVQVYFVELEEQGLSISDRARRKAALNGFARWLIEEQSLLQRNPLRAVALPAQPLLAPRELSSVAAAGLAECAQRAPNRFWHLASYPATNATSSAHSLSATGRRAAPPSSPLATGPAAG